MSELEHLQRQLEATRAELQDFVSTVSHDLRAPLRHINAYAQVIAEDWPELPAEMADHLSTIRESAQLLSRQLDGLTQLSRLAGLPVSLEPVNVSTLVREVADDVAKHASNTAVNWQLARDVPPVLADKTMLRQVLVQLLGNALKFSRGRDTAQISLSWQSTAAGQSHPSEQSNALGPEADRPTCCIRITDQGIGFRPEQAGKLFKVFGKLHPAREFEGLGLGLLQCRKLMERQGGTISISGALDQGCCVTLHLPLASV